MSLRKPPTMTARRLAANRASAQHSTGPTSFEGKFRSRWNALRTGSGTAVYDQLVAALMECAPGAVRATAAAILTPEERSHPFYAGLIERFCAAQEFAFECTPAYRSMMRTFRRRRQRRKERVQILKKLERSQNVL